MDPGQTLYSQVISRYNTFSYTVNEGLLQSTIGHLAIDKNNFCWITFPNGLQQFDGNNFTTVKIQPGLPDDKSVKLFRCKNGDLLFSHSQGISKYETGSNHFTQVYKQASALQKPACFIGEDEGIIYFYDGNATIHGMECNSFKIVSSISTPLPPFNDNDEYTPHFSNDIIDHKIALWVKKNICIWDLENKKMSYRSPEISDASIFFLYLLPGTKVLYTSYTDYNALQCLDFIKGTTERLPLLGKDKDIYISRFNILRWQEKYIVAINNHIYEADSTFRVFRSELVNFQNQPVAGNVTIADMIEDNFGNIYIQTVNGGIRKIIRNNYPVKYYGSLPDENKVIGILPDKENNRIFAGTSGSGLFVFDTMQRLITHIANLPGSKFPFGVNAIIRDNNGDYHLFVVGQKNIWKLSSDLSSLTNYPVSFPDTMRRVVDYFGSPIYRDDKEVITQSMFQVYRTSLTGSKTTASFVSGDYCLAKLWYDKKIIYSVNNYLIWLDAATLKEIKRIPFQNTGGVRCFTKDNEGNILVGTNKGIFRIDINGKVLGQWNKATGLPDDCIYAITFDRNGHMWASSNKGIFRIDKNNNILQLTKDDGLQENEFNTGVVSATEDGELFFGGMNGVSSFFPSAINSFDEKKKILITGIRINNEDIQSDSAYWNINKLKLNYNQNSLSFDFVAMANNNPAQYIYQYRMVGIDKEWIQNSGMQTVRYSLPPGKYTFQLYASRSFDKGAKPMKELRIIIKSPFWKSWLFLTALGVVILSLLTYSINQRNKSKYEKKLQQLENEKQIKSERERISKDLHDSLGAYANAVLHNTDLLEKATTEQKRKKLIGDLKFTSKDIITSLRETVWALKKEGYSAEDCLLRIRNFIQPFTRYYGHINFKVTGEAPAEMTLHYTKALNLVRIIQEAVSNSIKHAHASNITIISESFQGQWKLVVADDGQGFDYAATSTAATGNGLNNMKYRAGDSGFQLNIHTEQNAGTAITIIV